MTCPYKELEDVKNKLRQFNKWMSTYPIPEQGTVDRAYIQDKFEELFPDTIICSALKHK